MQVNAHVPIGTSEEYYSNDTKLNNLVIVPVIVDDHTKHQCFDGHCAQLIFEH